MQCPTVSCMLQNQTRAASHAAAAAAASWRGGLEPSQLCCNFKRKHNSTSTLDCLPCMSCIILQLHALADK